ncbi:hypothetical protein ABC345_21275 [Shouchella sp. 1P09AA]|uniref:hypothetical protein n=1 Tax=unclassified Shouchella TaxID=2893065 RepID=UPI0039A0CFE1
MIFKEICFFIYDKSVMEKAINYLCHVNWKTNIFKDNGLIIKKGWVNGLHIKIIVSSDNINNLERMEFIVHSYLENLRDELMKNNVEEIDYDKFENVVNNLAILENYKGEYLPLAAQFSISSNEYNHQSGMKDAKIGIKEEEILTELFLEVGSYYYHLTSEQRLIFLLKLFTILGDYKSLSSKSTIQPINESYLSYKSHLEGFKQQIKHYPFETRKKILNNLEVKNQVEEEFINENFGEFLNHYRNDFKNYEEIDKGYLIYYLNAVKELDALYYVGLKNNQITFNQGQSISQFYEDNTDLSEFHKSINEHVNLDFYNTEEVLLGRLLVNWFYTLLPLFSASVLTKNKLCNLVCRGVERVENKNYLELIKDFSETLDGGIRT